LAGAYHLESGVELWDHIYTVEGALCPFKHVIDWHRVRHSNFLPKDSLASDKDDEA
jgi:hypothetical protein